MLLSTYEYIKIGECLQFYILLDLILLWLSKPFMYKNILECDSKLIFSRTVS